VPPPLHGHGGRSAKRRRRWFWDDGPRYKHKRMFGNDSISVTLDFDTHSTWLHFQSLHDVKERIITGTL